MYKEKKKRRKRRDRALSLLLLRVHGIYLLNIFIWYVNTPKDIKSERLGMNENSCILSHSLHLNLDTTDKTHQLRALYALAPASVTIATTHDHLVKRELFLILEDSMKYFKLRPATNR